MFEKSASPVNDELRDEASVFTNQVGTAGSERWMRTRQMLRQRIAKLECERHELEQALEDTNDPAVQKILRIISLA